MSSNSNLEELTKSIAQLSLDNESKFEQLTKEIKARDKKIEELGEVLTLLISINERENQAKLEKKLQTVPKLKKTQNLDFYNYFVYWTYFKKILIDNHFEEFVKNVEAQNKSFFMNKEKEESLIDMIRSTVEPGYHYIVDNNYFLPENEVISAANIMLQLKDRAVGNNPTEENFKFILSKMSLGINYHDIDEYFQRVYTINQQIKFVKVNITENVIAGILFRNLGGPYKNYVNKLDGDLGGITDTSEYFDSIEDYKQDINQEYKRIKFQLSSADVRKDYTQKRNKPPLTSSTTTQSNSVVASSKNRSSRTRADKIKFKKIREINNSETIDTTSESHGKRSVARLHTCNN